VFKYYAFILVSLLVFSCKKKGSEDSPQQPLVYPSYSNLKLGNYWIYQVYNIDEAGMETLEPELDSAIINDTVRFEGNLYYHLAHQSPYNYDTYLRDSLNYIVLYGGPKMFSSSGEEELLNTYFQVFSGDTACRTEMKMDTHEELFTVPAGTFLTRKLNVTYYWYPGFDKPNPVLHGFSRYAKDIGLIAETFAFTFGTSAHYERRLLRYHIQK
jgi:hypothetical protein